MTNWIIEVWQLFLQKDDFLNFVQDLYGLRRAPQEMIYGLVVRASRIFEYLGQCVSIPHPFQHLNQALLLLAIGRIC